jgi:hypothetical protein
MLFFNQIKYVDYWERMLECSKNIFTEIPITLLELKIIFQNCGKIIRKTSWFTSFSYNCCNIHVKPTFFQNFSMLAVMCEIKKIILILKNLERKWSFHFKYLANQWHCLKLPLKWKNRKFSLIFSGIPHFISNWVAKNYYQFFYELIGKSAFQKWSPKLKSVSNYLVWR